MGSKFFPFRVNTFQKRGKNSFGREPSPESMSLFLNLEFWHINFCHAEWITMPRPLLIFSQSDYLIQVVDTNSNTEWQTVQIQIRWLLQKPADLDLHCLQRQGISGFCRKRVKLLNILFFSEEASYAKLWRCSCRYWRLCESLHCSTLPGPGLCWGHCSNSGWGFLVWKCCCTAGKTMGSKGMIAFDWWLECCGFDPRRVGNILLWRLIMKYFLWSFSHFRWFKKGSCQFLVKECAQYWLTA